MGKHKKKSHSIVRKNKRKDRKSHRRKEKKDKLVSSQIITIIAVNYLHGLY